MKTRKLRKHLLILATWSTLILALSVAAPTLAEGSESDLVSVEGLRGFLPYELAGISTGSVENTAGLGAMHAACQLDFGSGARMCTTVEASRSIRLLQC